MTILEEQPGDTVVGNFTAIDEDINENGAIDYMFIDGNQEDIFMITRTDDNAAVITTMEKLDRELASSYLLTVKCFKLGSNNQFLYNSNSYNNHDLSEIQILIKIIDIDDHLPEFKNKQQAIGIRSNVPIDREIYSVKAIDQDPEALPIFYHIQDISFQPQFYKRENSTAENLTDLFILNNATGEIRTGRSMADFVDGYFEVNIRANNSPSVKRFADNKIKIFVIRDKSLLRFVFTKPASEVEGIIDDFANRIQEELTNLGLELYILDTQVLTRPDQSLDFSSTR